MKFSKANNCWKRVFEAAKLAHVNKTKTYHFPVIDFPQKSNQTIH